MAKRKLLPPFLLLSLLAVTITAAEARSTKGEVAHIVDSDIVDAVLDAGVGPGKAQSAPAIEVELPALTGAERAKLLRWEDQGPLRFGIGRKLPDQNLDHSGSVRVRSAGAEGLRLGVRVSRLPGDALLRLSAPGAEDQVIAGAAIPEGELYWLPLMLGDTLVLEVELSPAAEQPEIHLEMISHFFALPPAIDAQQAACSGDWELPIRATAVLLHTTPDGHTGACSGTLLADTDPTSNIPYLLTAHHCVPDQARASSIESYWFPSAERPGARVTGGAELLYASKTTDTSFLRLRRPAPAGATFASWSPDLPEIGASVAGVHYPRGGPRQLALGEVREVIGCDEIEYCGEYRGREDEHYLRVVWSEGSTAPGSSGSGLFLPGGLLVGVLSGGRRTTDDYGRFDLAYREGLRQWLEADNRLGLSPDGE